MANSSLAIQSSQLIARWPQSSMEERIQQPGIEYPAGDDKIIEQFIRENVNTAWHSLGTYAMRRFQDGGVVDKDLNVSGALGLKLCDLRSVHHPTECGANANNTALMVVGEKAAEIMLRELTSNV